ncbi:PREDICTED: 28S ribosomal protein S23, mitochondrial [Papilio polytes]|uniref:28S ribosomal protein S23, mitochondrial n=1 Tax=Papilio polytes TaxID=76194 RepID=UPI000676A0BB|nr:PREDICTED: 28S ribosomal protein S23, mitochondrial [Papilio polytes]
MATSRLERIGTIFTRVEGLLTRGAMKPDDRPLWFDVYRAFPPNEEPKFARPKPEVKKIRQILYKEDAIRAKFHAEGHGLGVNMLNPSGETQTKRLIQQYAMLKSEGVPENELIEKSIAAVSAERQISSKTTKNPDSVTAQVLGSADIKNIFKE